MINTYYTVIKMFLVPKPHGSVFMLVCIFCYCLLISEKLASNHGIDEQRRPGRLSL